MGYFIFIFLISTGLIYLMDSYFYRTIGASLEFLKLDSQAVLNSMGYYNRSIFPNRIYGLLIGLVFSSIIFLGHSYRARKKEEEDLRKIKELEKELIRINKGDYAIKIEGDDKYSSLRDEIYKIIVSLKSLEEEALSQKSRLKEDLSNIAHQLKTPITSMGFMLELINEDQDNMDLYLEKLEGELEKLRVFTHLLLKLSKVNSDTIDYKMEPLSMMEILDDILNNLNRDGRVKVKIEGQDFKLLGDEVWLYEGILNIVKNSLEHTKDQVLIGLESNPIYSSLTVSDNGKGLDPKLLNKIFQRFYRGETSLPGYGIGLNLSKSIIERHNGKIEAFNDQGLTFRIKFYNVT